MTKVTSILLVNEKSTLELGYKLSKNLSKGLLIFLKGELGAGKTTLVRGLLIALGYKGRVKSPSYSLLEQYNFEAVTFNHFDLYRFHSPQEWISAGFNEYINNDDITLIEWPEKAFGVLCKPDISLEILYEGESSRRINIVALTKKGTQCCLELI